MLNGLNIMARWRHVSGNGITMMFTYVTCKMAFRFHRHSLSDLYCTNCHKLDHIKNITVGFWIMRNKAFCRQMVSAQVSTFNFFTVRHQAIMPNTIHIYNHFWAKEKIKRIITCLSIINLYHYLSLQITQWLYRHICVWYPYTLIKSKIWMFSHKNE